MANTNRTVRPFAAAFLGLAVPIAAQCATPWSAGSTQTDGAVQALAVMPNGDIIAGGSFTQIEGVPANRIARWNGSTWSALGSGTNGVVNSLCVVANGELLIGGAFTMVGGTPTADLGRWNGTTWSTFAWSWRPNNLSGAVNAIVELANGTIAVGGYTALPFFLPLATAATWDGSAWTPVIFPANTFGVVHTMAESPTGGLLIGGQGLSGLRRWDGTTMSAFAPGGEVTDLVRLAAGHLVAAGYFTSIGGVPANNIARWDGTSWSAFGAGTPTTSRVSAVQPLPNGDIIAGGAFVTAGGATANNIARWSGSAWSAFGVGIQGPTGSTTTDVRALAFPPAGPLFVGGSFTLAGGAACQNLARLGTTCPAGAAAHGSGCPSSGGSNTLAATTPPWVDATFTATGTGLPANALVLTLTSVTAFPQGLVPLTLAFPQAGPGCDVLVAPDILAVIPAVGGTAVSQLFLPNTPPLVGVTFYHQLVPFEIGGPGAITATNALQLTAGQF